MDSLYPRLIVGLLVITVLVFRWFYDNRHKSRITSESSRGKAVATIRSLVQLVGGAVIMFCLVFEPLPMNLEESANMFMRWYAVGLGLFAFALIIWSRVMEIRRNTWAGPMTQPESIEGHQLVTWGPYRFIRHPTYSGIILGGISIVLASASNLALLFAPPVIAIQILFAVREERHLLEKYGEDYAHYMAQTSRFIPFLI